jgi:hypothetical protein
VSDLDLTDLEARLIGERNGGFDNDEVRALIREAREARRLREGIRDFRERCNKGDRKEMPAPNPNRCADCGKFDRWENLELQIDYDMDMGGNVKQDEYFTHKHGEKCDG